VQQHLVALVEAPPQQPLYFCSAVLDGIQIDQGNLDDSHVEYVTLNRIFCNDHVRRTKYGRSLKGVATSHERKIVAPVDATEGATARTAVRGIAAANDANPTVLLAAQAAVAYVPAVKRFTHPNLVRAMRSMTYDARFESQPTMFHLGLDGHFPYRCVATAMAVKSRLKILLSCSSENNCLRQVCSQKNPPGYLHPGESIF